jgi:hypothetical protein
MQIMAQTDTGQVQRGHVFLAPDCPARGHRVNVAYGVASAIGYAEH